MKVLDLLGGAGQATMAVLEAYPRWVTTCHSKLVLDPHLAVACRARVTLLEKCPERVAQCEQALARIVPPAKLEAAFQQEVIRDLLTL